MDPKLEPDLRDTVCLGRKWLADFNGGETQHVLFDQSNNATANNVKTDEFFEEKSSFKMLGFCFSSQLGWGSIFEIESETKTASKKTGALVDSLKSISRQVALYLYKSIIRPGMKYSCHVLTLIC